MLTIAHVIFHWQVGYWKDMEQEEAAEKVRTEGNESSIILTGLEGNTLYHLRVKAYNAAGYGPPSSVVRAATKKSPPSQAPGNIMWIQDGSHVSLGWEPVRPLANESDVMGYKHACTPAYNFSIIAKCNFLSLFTFGFGLDHRRWKSHKFSIKSTGFLHFFIDCNFSFGTDGSFDLVVKTVDLLFFHLFDPFKPQSTNGWRAVSMEEVESDVLMVQDKRKYT
ncbi:hypothetical protein lerEdw1_005919 [Lerista edwardsae]|nr:hypothetical protein lerEdw1_005919 [Lerista edwardsae]